MTIHELGRVKWDFQGASYQSGLEKIYNIHQPGTPNFMRIHVLCREIAIAKSDSGQLAGNFIKAGKILVEEKVLTPQELAYIYEQFELNPETFILPEHLKES